MTGPGDPLAPGRGATPDLSAGLGGRAGTGTPPPGPADDEPEARRSLGDLIGDVTQDLSLLVRQEVELAKAELTQSAKRAATGSGMLAGAGLAAYFVLLFASIALWWGLPLGRAWSALVVVAVWAVIAAVLALGGRAELRRVQGVPRTAETVKKIPNALKGDEEENHE